MKRLLRALASAGVVGALALSLATAMASADSVKLGLPRHVKVGQRFSFTVTGFASPKPRIGGFNTITQVALLSDRQPCRRTDDAEGRIRDVTIWFIVPVHGRFKYVDRIHYAQTTHGKQYFCAYVLYVPATSSTSVTTARTSRRFKIPS